MKINKTILIVFLLLVLVIASAIFVVQKQKLITFQLPQEISLSEDTEATSTATTTAQTVTVQKISQNKVSEQVAKVPSDWQQVVNKKYGFSYSRPSSITDEYFFVDTRQEPESLQSYVQNIWSLNKNDTNPYAKDKKISEISEVNINGSLAYQFTLSNSFTWDESGSGYVLDDINLFTFFETEQKIKIITRAPIKTVSSQSENRYYVTILNSFKIDKNLIPTNEEPANWQTVNRDLFIFKFPGNLFKIDTEYTTAEKIYLGDIVDGTRGGVYVAITNESFDPANITGMYGPVKNPEKVVIGDKVWYSYLWGDAGAASRIYLTDIDGNKMLRVSFGSLAEEDVYPIHTDIVLQKLILATVSEI